ncbi:hypothetical protein J6590_053167 [Homalodisca vitripennis]|nr:hypothetical protein J6590_053167 [Homalodisca vitripennis]
MKRAAESFVLTDQVLDIDGVGGGRGHCFLVTCQDTRVERMTCVLPSGPPTLTLCQVSCHLLDILYSNWSKPESSPGPKSSVYLEHDGIVTESDDNKTLNTKDVTRKVVSIRWKYSCRAASLLKEKEKGGRESKAVTVNPLTCNPILNRSQEIVSTVSTVAGVVVNYKWLI